MSLSHVEKRQVPFRRTIQLPLQGMCGCCFPEPTREAASTTPRDLIVCNISSKKFECCGSSSAERNVWSIGANVFCPARTYSHLPIDDYTVGQLSTGEVSFCDSACMDGNKNTKPKR
ncbi:phage-associated protein, HI1409 family [Anopheles sinensis]|uniref:Phage-associated protein, HI1409 family n=1 Tax=Anopheles sinensis TaxID=74873 RepID=A0A084WKB8_ANOSI|nr:phage-associated protein, HI1409 family [Anopheles sinensis]